MHRRVSPPMHRKQSIYTHCMTVSLQFVHKMNECITYFKGYVQQFDTSVCVYQFRWVVMHVWKKKKRLHVIWQTESSDAIQWPSWIVGNVFQDLKSRPLVSTALPLQMNVRDSFKTNERIKSERNINISFLIPHVLFSFPMQLDTIGYAKGKHWGLCWSSYNDYLLVFTKEQLLSLDLKIVLIRKWLKKCLRVPDAR